jgi:hypothetical protein
VPDPADDPELLDFATKIFNLARTGDARALAAYVDAGGPADLTNDSGDSLRSGPGQRPGTDAARLFGNQEFRAWFSKSSGN